MSGQNPQKLKKYRNIIIDRGRTIFTSKRREQMSEQEKKEIQIQMDDATAQGMYSNLALIVHNETEFNFDFIYVQPEQPKATVRARIISSPSHTKRFFLALEQNIKHYEEQFGAIKASCSMDKKIGF